MKNYILKYGSVGGLILIVLGLLNWYLIAPYFTVSTSQTVGYLGITLSFLCVPMGIKYFRDKLNNGVVSFIQAFKIGISITLVVSVIMFFYSMLFHIFQGEKFQEWQFKDLQGAELQAMQEQMAAMPEFSTTPWFQGLVLFVLVFLIGLVVCLLSAFLLKQVEAERSEVS